MKKRNVTLGVLSVLLVLVIALFAVCLYFTITSFSLPGVYWFQSMSYEVGGKTETVKAGDEMEIDENTTVKIKKDFMKLTINKDNTWELVEDLGLSDEESELVTSSGTWKKDGDKYYLYEDESELMGMEINVSTWKVSFEMDLMFVQVTTVLAK